MRGAALLLALAAALPGCGFGPGEQREGGAELRVTRDFGQKRLASARVDRIREGQTVMRLLRSEREVKTRYGGGFVQSIDGLAGEGADGRRDWFYFVNGIEASVGSADYELSPGDVVQWDHRRWDAAMSVPAIVGAYPEPFLHGSRGKRLPVRVECDDERGEACSEVKRRLGGDGVPVSGAPLGSAAGKGVLRVVVAPWTVARRVRALAGLERGPGESGVFARFTPRGTLTLLDERARPARPAPAGSGLVAATALRDQQVVWAVTGVDEAGVESAASALDDGRLRDAFAVATTPDGAVHLPLVRESAEGDGG